MGEGVDEWFSKYDERLFTGQHGYVIGLYRFRELVTDIRRIGLEGLPLH